MPLTLLTKVLKFHHLMPGILQLYFHSLYINSVSENVTEALRKKEKKKERKKERKKGTKRIWSSHSTPAMQKSRYWSGGECHTRRHTNACVHSQAAAQKVHRLD